MSLDRWVGFASLGDLQFLSARMMMECGEGGRMGPTTKQSLRLVTRFQHLSALLTLEYKRPEEKVKGKPSHRSWVPNVSPSSFRMTRANLATSGLNRDRKFSIDTGGPSSQRPRLTTCFLCPGCWRGSGQWRTALAYWVLLGLFTSKKTATGERCTAGSAVTRCS